jgi:hypothetical protein
MRFCGDSGMMRGRCARGAPIAYALVRMGSAPSSTSIRGRRGLRFAWTALAAAATCALAPGCSAKTATNGPPNNDTLKCLTTLASHCCELSARGSVACDPNWSNATLCNSWPSGTSLTIYSLPCQGLRAIRVKAATYSSFFIYDESAALVAIGDNAAEDPGSTVIDCGAGPSAFVVPAECGAKWLGASDATSCDPTTGTAAARRDWCHDVYYGDAGD